MFQHERRNDESIINLHKHTVQLMNVSAGACPALQASEIKDISHLSIRVQWPLQGSGWRTGNLPGVQVPMGMLIIFPRNADSCWVQYLTGRGKMACYVAVVWLKPNQFSSSRGFTAVLLLNSAFCVIHTCRGDMKRNWDLLFTYLLWLWCPQDIYIDKGQVPCPCC